MERIYNNNRNIELYPAIWDCIISKLPRIYWGTLILNKSMLKMIKQLSEKYSIKNIALNGDLNRLKLMLLPERDFDFSIKFFEYVCMTNLERVQWCIKNIPFSCLNLLYIIEYLIKTCEEKKDTYFLVIIIRNSCKNPDFTVIDYLIKNKGEYVLDYDKCFQMLNYFIKRISKNYKNGFISACKGGPANCH